MKPLLCLLALIMPLALAAGELSLAIDLSDFDPGSARPTPGWGSVSAPGYPQLPVKTVNVILPPGAAELSFGFAFSAPLRAEGPAPAVNPPFTDGESVLASPAATISEPRVQNLGIRRWGEVCYASFRVLPRVFDDGVWRGYGALNLDLNWTDPPWETPNRLPPALADQTRTAVSLKDSFFANPSSLDRFYAKSQSRNYDYLIVGTPALRAAVSALETYRQSQGFVTAFADIAAILASNPGATNGEKLRNYLIAQYAAQPFTYLLLLGDHDTVPVMLLSPQPDGPANVPSDFFYSDLSSVIDSDGDGLLGEYSSGLGDQDWLCDFTPELFVGRISTNDAAVAAQIASRTVAYEQSSAPWKQNLLLPAAFLNYGGEPDPVFPQTDGATLMEIAKASALSGSTCVTLYEQLGCVPSYPSDLPLDFTILKNQLSANSFGILSWSAHGSAISSSRKIWLADTNGNQLPDAAEMSWQSMISKTSFENLANPDGLIIFAASCNNGMLDYSQPCLAEYALQKKAVNVVAATRTGWYKPGWANPGWGGLGSYNYHWLENKIRNGASAGAASAFTNLLHTQYYLFGDPIDEGGIIYPELQNVYTYLLFGDPAVGHSGGQSQPQAEILVYEPGPRRSLAVVDAINAAGRFNAVYTDKLIPDYDYIDRFEAVFCLFGWGAETHAPDSLDLALLTAYLDGGGKIYLEGDLDWDPADSLLGKFGTHAPLDVVAHIEQISALYGGRELIWGYGQSDPETYVPLPCLPTAKIAFRTENQTYGNHPLGVFNTNGNYRTVASAFALADVISGENSLANLIGVILDTLNVISVPFPPFLPPQNPAVERFGADLQLSWDPVASNTLGQAVTIDHYEVWVSYGSPEAGFTLLDVSTEPQYLHVGGAAWPFAFYRIVAK